MGNSSVCRSCFQQLEKCVKLNVFVPGARISTSEVAHCSSCPQFCSLVGKQEVAMRTTAYAPNSRTNNRMKSKSSLFWLNAATYGRRGYMKILPVSTDNGNIERHATKRILPMKALKEITKNETKSFYLKRLSSALCRKKYTRENAPFFITCYTERCILLKHSHEFLKVLNFYVLIF